MKTGIWAVEQRIQYTTLMLYHNIKNTMRLRNHSAKETKEKQPNGNKASGK